MNIIVLCPQTSGVVRLESYLLFLSQKGQQYVNSKSESPQFPHGPLRKTLST